MGHWTRTWLRIVHAFRRVTRGVLRWPFRLFFAGLAVGLVLPSCFAVDRLRHVDCVLPGVWAHTVSLGGLDAEQARDALKGLDARLRRMPLTAMLGSRVFRLSPEDIDLRVDHQAMVDDAFQVGRQDGPVAQFVAWLRSWRRPTHVGLRLHFSDAKLDRILGAWERRGLNVPSEGGLRLERGRIVPELPHAGERIDRRQAAEWMRVRAGVQLGTLELRTRHVEPQLEARQVEADAERARALVAGPVELIAPEGTWRLALSAADLTSLIRGRPEPTEGKLELHFDPVELDERLAALRSELERPPEDARFDIDSRDRIRVVPGRPGARLVAADVAEALLRAAHAPERTGPLPILRDAEPDFTTEQALALGIKQRVSAFTTRHACCQPRVRNIQRMADLLDGVVLKPGETLSVNQRVGRRTEKNGFVPAPGIEEGEMVDTVGGGVSQFATTLYNAVFWGGYDVVQRQPHSYWFPRYPMGHEATLSWPQPDLVFKNDSDAGLLIKTRYTKTSVTVELFGDNGGRKVRAQVSGRSDFVEPPVELVSDQGVPPDEERVRDAGTKGWSVQVARVVVMPDGRTKEEKRKVTYMPRTRRVAVHPCRIPAGEEGHTGERCPEPEDVLIDAGADAPPDGPAASAP